MNLLLRIFSPSYRRALAAEAAGSYLEAARAYALCGLRHKVAEMHLLESDRLAGLRERAGESLDARLHELRAAVHWLDDGSPEGRALLGRVGRAYVAALTQAAGGPGRAVISAREQQLCREAAQLSLRAGDPLTAGEAFELCGDREGAAEAYKDAGEIERMEALLRRQERQRTMQSEERERFADYRLHMQLGRRDQAALSLRACMAAAADPAEPGRLLRELGERLLSGGKVLLRGPSSPPGAPGAPGHGEAEAPIWYVGAFPLLIGRGADCHLVLTDPGVSRCHASISLSPALSPGSAPAFLLKDAGSRNGTALGGLPISGELPLRGAGVIGIGEHCALDFTVEGAALTLRVARGLGRGQVLRASPAPLPLDRGLELAFIEGRPHLRAQDPAARLVLNGQPAPPSVQLILGDVVEHLSDAGALRCEVLG